MDYSDVAASPEVLYRGSLVTPRSMTEAAAKNFGLLIAYVLPNFAALWALQPYSATLRRWFDTSPTIPADLEAVVFVTAASIAMGMTLGALRWLLIDSAFAALGAVRPQWDDTQFGARKDAFEALVDAHFRYYQFYAHTALVLPLFAVHSMSAAMLPPLAAAALLLLAEGVFLAAAYDALRKYFLRTSRSLGSTSRKGTIAMTNGHRKPERRKPTAVTKPTPKPVGSSATVIEEIKLAG